MTDARDFPELVAALGSRGDGLALSFYRGKALVGRLSYAELGDAVDRLALRLGGELGIARGDRVAVLAPNRLEVPVLVLALLSLGAVVVPLNPGSPPADWVYVLGHSRAKALAVTEDLGQRVPGEARPPVVLAIEECLRGGTAPRGAPRDASSAADLLAVVLYTSGTTGHPKGVALRQGSLLANGASMAANFRMSGTTQLAVLPLYHAHAFGFGLMTALTTGGHLVFCERLEPFTWAEVVRAEAVEVTSVVPTLLPMLLAAGVTRQKVPTLRHLLVSSAPLPGDLARAFETKTGLPITLGWGLSEYTNFACCVSPHEPDAGHERLMHAWETPSVGPALPGTEVRVVRPDGAPAVEGEAGELEVRGPSTMLGYLDDRANTSLVLAQDGWLKTGDEGCFRLHSGRPAFFITGRLKEIIIRDAEKYSPLAIERKLTAALPELAGRLVVVGFPHRAHGEEVGAYVESDDLEDGVRERLLAAIGGLPVAERPKVVLHGPAPVPRTHTGKVQRRKMVPWFERWRDHRGPPVVERVEAAGV